MTPRQKRVKTSESSVKVFADLHHGAASEAPIVEDEPYVSSKASSDSTPRASEAGMLAAMAALIPVEASYQTTQADLRSASRPSTEPQQ